MIANNNGNGFGTVYRHSRGPAEVMQALRDAKLVRSEIQHKIKKLKSLKKNAHGSKNEVSSLEKDIAKARYELKMLERKAMTFDLAIDCQ